MCTVRGRFPEKTATTPFFLWEVLKVLGPVYSKRKVLGVCYMAETQGVLRLQPGSSSRVQLASMPCLFHPPCLGCVLPEEGLKKVKMSIIQSCPDSV